MKFRIRGLMKNFTVLWFMTLMMFPVLSTAQDRMRTLEFSEYRQYDLSSEPIAIVKRELDDKPFLNEIKVIAGSDWLTRLRLTVKNISSKSIKVATIHLIVPKQGSMSSQAAMLLTFPSENVFDPEAETPNRRLLLWKPDQTISLKIPSHQLRLLDDLRNRGISDIDHVSLAIYRVEFEDGTGWFQGIRTRENPLRPGNWIIDHPQVSNMTWH